MEMNLDEYRFIDTGCWGTTKNRDVFNSVIGQMSDGIWENTPGMLGYWYPIDIAIISNHIVLQIKKYGDISYCGRWYRNKWYGMSDSEILKFFSNKIKRIIAIERKDEENPNLKIKKGNGETTVYLSYEDNITMTDLWNILNTMKTMIGEN